MKDPELPAVRARANAAPKILMSGESAPIYGGSGAGYIVINSVVIPAGTIKGGELIRIAAFMSKFAPNNAGWSWRVRLNQGANSRALVSNALGGGMIGAAIDHTVYIASDRKSAKMLTANGLNTAALNSAGQIAWTGIMSGTQVGSLAARTPAATMFVSYSSSPTVETVVINFDQDVTATFEMQALNGDCIKNEGFMIEILGRSANSSISKSTIIWGDSLTEGTGATAEAVTNYPMDIASQLRRALPGWPIAGMGLGGQTSQQIVDRLVADPIRGKLWNCILWIGTNDVLNTNGGADWWALVNTQITRAIAFRGDTQRLMICTLHPQASWSVGDANYVAMQYVNAQMAAVYGSAVCDLFTALATSAGKVPAGSMSDGVHLNNTGYGTAKDAMAAKISALGWS